MLGNVIDSLSDMLNRTLGNQVTLETRSTAEQPAYVDRSLFESAILNLALNARDAMPNGGLLTIATEIVHCAEGFAGGLLAGRLRQGHCHRHRRGHARRKSSSAPSTRSSRRRASARGPAWASRWSTASPSSRAAMSASRARSGTEPRCTSTFRYRCEAEARQPVRGATGPPHRQRPRAHSAGRGRAARAPLRLQSAHRSRL